MKILLFVLALWAFMSIAPSDGKDVRRYYGPKGTICKKGHHWIVKVKCTNKCKIRHPKAAFQWGGKVRITGRIGEAFRQKKKSCGKNCFCAKTSRKNWNQVFCKNHKGKKIKSDRVHFDIWCIKRTTKLRFRAYIKNYKPKMMEKKCPSGEKRHQDGACRKCDSGKYDASGTCTACNCDNDLATYQSCDASGNCFCKKNAEGKLCDSCADKFYKKTGTKVCSACGCNNPGTTDGGKCGADGKCTCKVADYKGDKCDGCTDAAKNKHEDGVCRKCNSGKYDDGAGNCKDCTCGTDGSKYQSCETSTGNCDCKNGYQGKDCKTCQDKFYKPTGQQVCNACGCDPDGSKDSGKCNSGDGKCSCKADSKGDKCVECNAADKYRPEAGGACQDCNCVVANTKGGATGCDRKGQCDCKAGKSGLDCSS